MSEHCVFREEITALRTGSHQGCLPHLSLRIETDTEDRGHDGPEFHPFLSHVQKKVALKPNKLILSKANSAPLIPPLNGDKWFLND